MGNHQGNHRYNNQANRGHRKPAVNGPDQFVKQPAFKARVVLDLEFDLAYDLGCLILDNARNPALIAMAKQIVGD